jgi:hypothetical protein
MNTFKNQIKLKQELLNSLVILKCKKQLNNKSTEKCDILINGVLSQIKNIIENDLIETFNLYTLNLPNKYITAEGIKRESALKNLEEVIKKEGFLPIDINPTENKILVIDINYLPSEYKDNNVDETRETLETIYGCKVLIIDGSRQNTQGTQNTNLPAYFI